jgi:hypothetical protein
MRGRALMLNNSIPANKIVEVANEHWTKFSTIQTSNPKALPDSHTTDMPPNRFYRVTIFLGRSKVLLQAYQRQNDTN